MIVIICAISVLRVPYVLYLFLGVGFFVAEHTREVGTCEVEGNHGAVEIDFQLGFMIFMIFNCFIIFNCVVIVVIVVMVVFVVFVIIIDIINVGRFSRDCGYCRGQSKKRS